MGTTDTRREIWVYGDRRSERLFGLSLKVLAKARQLASITDCRTAAVLIGAAPPVPASDDPTVGEVPLEQAIERCRIHGADRIYRADDPSCPAGRPDIHAAVMAGAVRQHHPRLVLFALTDRGRELSARTAGELRAGSIAKCIDITADKNNFVAHCPSGEGKYIARITFADSRQTGFATVQAAALPSTKHPVATYDVIPLTVDPTRFGSGIIHLSTTVQRSGAQNLEQAETVVVGGAGLRNSEGFSLTRQLAAVLGGALGATRPPVLQHWISEECLIGQTGKSVRPKLLFSIGTSGATQYVSGITEAGTIVAINRDPRAPIFQYADVGIVADATVLLPHLIARLKQSLMRDVAEALTDPTAADSTTGIGKKIRRLRQSLKWSTQALAKATGKTPEFIEGVEADQLTPSVAFMLRLARVMNTSPDTFLRQEDQEHIRDQRSKAMLTRTQNYSYEILSDEENSEHLRAFSVVIEPRQAHKPVAYKHEGEEFILVQQGELELTLGTVVHKLKVDESIHFNSELPHKLKSLSDIPTKCLVVLYTP